MTKLEATKENHPEEGWLKGMIEYGKYGIMTMKDKLDSLDDKKLQMIPFMKQHHAAVDFVRTALLVCKEVLQKRGIIRIGNIDTINITTVSDTVAGGDKVKDTVIHESTKKDESGDANKMMKSTESKDEHHIAIPNNEDVISSTVEVPEWACDERHSPNYMIYCQGDLLHAVMMLNIFKDSKTFVDKPLKRDPAEIAADFKRKFPRDITANDSEAIRQFIDENFDEEGHELEKCELVDWEEEPENLLSIEDPQLRQFALNVNLIWKNLCRTIKKEVRIDAEEK
ncbi:unnamed protein product, partial [Onchocerca flexuosa]|uniref:Trehalase n=1 Tax=Onchocerca flexuosa TaxID=387005 RepID=A0A183HEV2_9BILA